MGHNEIIPIEGDTLVRTGGQFLEPVEPTHLIKYKGIPKISKSRIAQKQTKYKLEPLLITTQEKIRF